MTHSLHKRSSSELPRDPLQSGEGRQRNRGQYLGDLRAQRGRPHDAHVDGRDRCAAVEEFDQRSEEHTSELQSLIRLSYSVFFLKKIIFYFNFFFFFFFIFFFFSFHFFFFFF